jgi:hypothetical protein
LRPSEIVEISRVKLIYADPETFIFLSALIYEISGRFFALSSADNVSAERRKDEDFIR